MSESKIKTAVDLQNVSENFNADILNTRNSMNLKNTSLRISKLKELLAEKCGRVLRNEIVTVYMFCFLIFFADMSFFVGKIHGKYPLFL